jgi:hypothetical protein
MAVTYLRAIRDLAGLLGCDPTEAGVFAHRRATDPDEYAATMLRATRTDWLLIDDGFLDRAPSSNLPRCSSCLTATAPP